MSTITLRKAEKGWVNGKIRLEKKLKMNNIQ
jgi:hypothetical protein